MVIGDGVSFAARVNPAYPSAFAAGARAHTARYRVNRAAFAALVSGLGVGTRRLGLVGAVGGRVA